MNDSYLLDTNIIVALFAGEQAVQDRIVKALSVYIPAIVLGELYYGAMKSAKVAHNIARVDTLAGWSVLNPDRTTAIEYGKAKALLASKGRPIPENDIWISAIALQYGLTLVTRDAHFSEVDHLILEKW